MATTEIYTYGHTLSLHDALPIYQHCPDETLAMSKNFCGSSPSFCASARLSHVATIDAPSSILLQIFAACPAPASPAWITALPIRPRIGSRSEEHTSELQSLMRISYAVFCLKKKKTKHQ